MAGFEIRSAWRLTPIQKRADLRAMKTETKTIMLAAAAIAGLLTGCATREQKKECKTCDVSSVKGHKASCGTKADCSSKHTCRGKGNCGGRNGCGAKR
jgi:hypothetical protein